jgi:hypothetical protein
MSRRDPKSAIDQLWADIEALGHEASGIGVVGPDGVRRKGSAGRFMARMRKGRADGRLVAAVDELLREAPFGAVLDDPRNPDVLLEQRIVLAPKSYSFLWSQSTLDLARKRVRARGGR